MFIVPKLEVLSHCCLFYRGFALSESKGTSIAVPKDTVKILAPSTRIEVLIIDPVAPSIETSSWFLCLEGSISTLLWMTQGNFKHFPFHFCTNLWFTVT